MRKVKSEPIEPVDPKVFEGYRNARAYQMRQVKGAESKAFGSEQFLARQATESQSADSSGSLQALVTDLAKQPPMVPVPPPPKHLLQVPKVIPPVVTTQVPMVIPPVVPLTTQVPMVVPQVSPPVVPTSALDPRPRLPVPRKAKAYPQQAAPLSLEQQLGDFYVPLGRTTPLPKGTLRVSKPPAGLQISKMPGGSVRISKAKVEPIPGGPTPPKLQIKKAPPMRPKQPTYPPPKPELPPSPGVNVIPATPEDDLTDDSDFQQMDPKWAAKFYSGSGYYRSKYQSSCLSSRLCFRLYSPSCIRARVCHYEGCVPPSSSTPPPTLITRPFSRTVAIP